jgi:hypothetical protein
MKEGADMPIAFRSAVEARDADAVRESLAPGVHFYSPLRYRPFTGRDEVAAVLSIPASVFAFHDTFRYTRTLTGPDGWAALFFEAQVGDRFLEGVDYLTLNGDGLVDELRVMMRPLAQIQTFAERAVVLFESLALERSRDRERQTRR